VKRLAGGILEKSPFFQLLENVPVCWEFPEADFLRSKKQNFLQMQ
jgi:hypothetical protein